MSSPRIEILTGDQIAEQVWEVPCNADLFGKRVNGKHVDRLYYLDPSEARKEIHITAFIGERIVGIAGLEQSPWTGEEDLLWIKHVSVEEKYQGQGLGRMLEEAAYAYALEHGKRLHHSDFSEMGSERLKALVTELEARYPQCVCHCSRCNEQLCR